MDSTGAELDETSSERFNYFNYFTEVEEEFVRRRGSHMLVSTLDWALIEAWKDSGIPLHLVLRGINQAFDNYDAHPVKHKKVNRLFYCQQAVESLYADYRQSRVGAAADVAKASESADRGEARSTEKEGARFSKESVLGFLARCTSELAGATANASASGTIEAAAAMERGIARLREISAEVEGSSRLDAEALELDLDSVDRMILDSLRASMKEDDLASIRSEAEKPLRKYRKKMEKAIYERTIGNFVSRRLREINGVPRLSLFYM